MSDYITKKQYRNLTSIPRDRLATRAKVFCGVIAEKDNKVLMVLENKEKHPGYDLPGGKLLWGESVKDCAGREFEEETGYKVKLTKFVGVFQRADTEEEVDYFRFIFSGEIKGNKKKIMDDSVIGTSWISLDDIKNEKMKVRNIQVLIEIERYFSGVGVDMSFIDKYSW